MMISKGGAAKRAGVSRHKKAALTGMPHASIRGRVCAPACGYLSAFAKINSRTRF